MPQQGNPYYGILHYISVTSSTGAGCTKEQIIKAGYSENIFEYVLSQNWIEQSGETQCGIPIYIITEAGRKARDN